MQPPQTKGSQKPEQDSTWQHPKQMHCNSEELQDSISSESTKLLQSKDESQKAAEEFLNYQLFFVDILCVNSRKNFKKCKKEYFLLS